MCKSILEWRTAQKITQTEAAALAGVGQAAWAKWERGQVPAEQCLKMHRITAIPLHILRPDIYPAPPMRRATDRKGIKA
jgi:transcriptional regulator with XRE-family HTH domain